SECGPSFAGVRDALPMPAQLTAICTVAKCSAALATAASTSGPEVTSAATNIALAPKLSASFAPGDDGRSRIATFAPRSANSCAVAAPNPEPPPVITATASLRLIRTSEQAAISRPQRIVAQQARARHRNKTGRRIQRSGIPFITPLD